MLVYLKEKQIELIIGLIVKEVNYSSEELEEVRAEVNEGRKIRSDSEPVLKRILEDYEACIRLDMKLWKHLPDSEKKKRSAKADNHNLLALKDYKKWLSEITFHEQKEAFNNN